MNTLKPLLIVAVLAGIGYGVYVRINNGNDAPPPDVADGWDAAPRVQLPDPGASTSGPAWIPPSSPIAGGGAAPPLAPPAAVATTPMNAAPGGDAPRYSPPAATGEAPPYSPPVSGAMPAGVPAVAGAPAYQQNTSPPPIDQPGGLPPGSAHPNMPDSAPPSTAQAPPGTPPDTSATPSYATGPAGQPPASAPGAASATAPTGPAAGGFAATIETARHELESGQLSAALRQLSVWYDDPRLSPVEQQQLNQLLDQVAGTVVYSTQHLLEAPYESQPNERLEDIAQRYNVPWQLLAKINGIEDPQTLRAGERLKVMRGPFTALVSLDKRQLTLWLGDGSYAGRFPIGVGREHPPAEGVYAVSDKSVNPVYRGVDRSIGGGDPANPLGDRWIGLGSEIGIHGTNRPDSIGRTDLPGSISLSPRDAADVYDILSVGSKVIVRR